MGTRMMKHYGDAISAAFRSGGPGSPTTSAGRRLSGERRQQLRHRQDPAHRRRRLDVSLAAPMQQELTFAARQQYEMIDLTADVARDRRRRRGGRGLCSVFVPHATAAVVINENDDPNLCDDLLDALDQTGSRGVWRHDRVDGNGAAHIKAAILARARPSLSRRPPAARHLAGDHARRPRRPASAPRRSSPSARPRPTLRSRAGSPAVSDDTRHHLECVATAYCHASSGRAALAPRRLCVKTERARPSQAGGDSAMPPVARRRWRGIARRRRDVGAVDAVELEHQQDRRSRVIGSPLAIATRSTPAGRGVEADQPAIGGVPQHDAAGVSARIVGDLQIERVVRRRVRT